ncbi:DNA alkylation repair protein [Sanyastnella coralliicola]|uniref:DNA alkylation repair protein n=1 Tax=Sanyastnella coralliicola TaxID=3069118 RepID=UPI0027B91B98|nr:DNA alkylation repair protein [Longitalea sp. SCSIO 12813]
MPEPLKNMYSPAFISQLSERICSYDASVDAKAFERDVFDKQWEARELKDRMKHIASVMKEHLAGDYDQQLGVVEQMALDLDAELGGEMNFEYVFLTEFIEQFGQHDLERSVAGMTKVTQFTSCEFAVRPYILQDPERMHRQMKEWATHEHAMVRRLATEGYRPRLPWGMALGIYKKDPTNVIEGLEMLKDDPSETVRRSVANNLNDIAKDHPNTVVAIAKHWYGASEERNWLVKHACRTLLKEGRPDVLEIFGYAKPSAFRVSEINITSPLINASTPLSFEFNIENKAKSASLLRLEYAIHFLKANGSHNKKVFKISERELKPGEQIQMERKQSFKPISTRKMYPGVHYVSLVVNGEEKKAVPFELE